MIGKREFAGAEGGDDFGAVGMLVGVFHRFISIYS